MRAALTMLWELSLAHYSRTGLPCGLRKRGGTESERAVAGHAPEGGETASGGVASRSTSTSVDIARSAMIAQAITVPTAPGGATRTPPSWASTALMAWTCRSWSVAPNVTAISCPRGAGRVPGHRQGSWRSRGRIGVCPGWTCAAVAARRTWGSPWTPRARTSPVPRGVSSAGCSVRPADSSACTTGGGCGWTLVARVGPAGSPRCRRRPSGPRARWSWRRRG